MPQVALPRADPHQPPMAATSSRSASLTARRGARAARLVILGHHYQRDEVIRYADFTGDSFKLAQHAATRPEAEFIVFCGVHFMAESADILSAPHQTGDAARPHRRLLDGRHGRDRTRSRSAGTT